MGIYLKVELLGYRVIISLTLVNKVHTAFQNSCGKLNSLQQGIRAPIAPHPHQQHLSSAVCVIQPLWCVCSGILTVV